MDSNVSSSQKEMPTQIGDFVIMDEVKMTEYEFISNQNNGSV